VVIDEDDTETTATLLTVADYDEGNVSIDVQVGTVVSVGIPEQVFTDLDEEEVVLVVVELSDDMSKEYEEVDAAGTVIVSVEATVSINIYSDEGSKLEVSDLTEPLLLQFAIPADVEAPHLLRCAVWDEILEEWSFDGIEQLGIRDGILSCTTRHLSLFGMIWRGFVETFRCSQASLLTTKGIRQLWVRDWAVEPTVAVLWVVLVVLLLLLTSACVVDLHRIQKGVFWTDTGFFVYVDDEDETSKDESAARICGSLWLGATWETLSEAKTILWKSIRDEVIAATMTFLDVLRGACSGQLEMLQNAKQEADEESNPNPEGSTQSAENNKTQAKRGYKERVRILLEAAARQWLRWAVHLKASSSAFVHYHDNYQQTVDSLAASELQDQNPTGDSPNPAKAAKSPSPDQSTEVASNPEAAPTSRTTPTSKSRPSFAMQSTRSGSGLPASLSRDFSASAAPSAAPSNTPSLSLAELHTDQSQRLDSEYRYIHSFRHNLKSVGTQLLVHGPIGSVFAFSIFKSSGLRALEFSCLVLGDLAVSTLFMSVSGKTRRAANTASCSSEDFFEMAGKFIALGVATTFVAVLPVVAIFKMQTRKFHTVPFENCRAMRRRLRAWKVLDALVWFFGLAYAGFCAFYVMLFFANVAPVDHHAWLITACTAFVLDLMVTPAGSVLVIFLILWLCVVVLALWTGQSRKQLVEQLRSTGEQSAALRSSHVSQASSPSSQPKKAAQGDQSEAEVTFEVDVDHQDVVAKVWGDNATDKETSRSVDKEGGPRRPSHTVQPPHPAADVATDNNDEFGDEYVVIEM